jgi:hypothetical protein
MIRRLLFAAAAFAVTLLAASPAEAQLRGMRFPASLQNIFLLRGDAVQSELTLKDDQKTAISELALALQQEAFEIISGLQDLTPEEAEGADAGNHEDGRRERQGNPREGRRDSGRPAEGAAEGTLGAIARPAGAGG